MKLLADKVRPVSIFLAAVFLPNSAAAEVCDKEVPGWDHAMGPVSEFAQLMDAIFSPLGLLLAGLLLSAMVLRKRWIPVIGFSFSVASFAGVISNSFAHSGIYAASIQEGCRAYPVVTLSLLLALTILFAWRGTQLWNWHIKHQNHEAGKP